MNTPYTPYIHTRQPKSIFRQSGVTLVELMVGIAIGLLVIAVAMGALMASRNITGSVSDVTTLQQQASHAFRIIGQQIKQAGSLELNLNPEIAGAETEGINFSMLPVAFDPPNTERPAFNRAEETITGSESPQSFTVGYQNYKEITTESSSDPTSLLRDCLGQNPALSAGGSLTDTPVIFSKFQRNADKNTLTCQGSGASGTQPIIENVTDFQIRYIVQTPNTINIKYTKSISDIENWNNVYAIEICIELTGSENTPIPDGTKYKNCNNIDTLYGNRLKMVFKNTYQIRSQGNS